MKQIKDESVPKIIEWLKVKRVDLVAWSPSEELGVLAREHGIEEIDTLIAELENLDPMPDLAGMLDCKKCGGKYQQWQTSIGSLFPYVKAPTNNLCLSCNEKAWEEWEKENEGELLRIADLQKEGHTHHCAHRLTWGDGECECGKAATEAPEPPATPEAADYRGNANHGFCVECANHPPQEGSFRAAPCLLCRWFPPSGPEDNWRPKEQS